MKILIVEDDDATRFFMAKVVRDQGHEVKTAENGQEGLATFKEFRPEIVLSDIQMPKMDGLQMLEKIRQKDTDALVIIISSLDSPQYTLKALRLKANDYLVKPAREGELIGLLKKYGEILESRTREREVLGLIYQKNMGMRIANRLDLVGKIADRLMVETEHLIPPGDRLGVHLGLVEMITNAIEHGNLEVTFDEKTKALEGEPHALQTLIDSRRKAPPYSQRFVDIRFRMENERCEWTITDQGPGFDVTKLPDPEDPENLLLAHGRGIMLTRIQFDEVRYQGKGNIVSLVKRLS